MHESSHSGGSAECTTACRVAQWRGQLRPFPCSDLPAELIKDVAHDFLRRLIIALPSLVQVGNLSLEIWPGIGGKQTMPFLLSRGGKNIPAEVQRWQYFLLKKGFPQTGKIDGDFGEKTEKATRFFQVAQGLKASGSLDKATLDAARALGYTVLPDNYYKNRSKPEWPILDTYGAIALQLIISSPYSRRGKRPIYSI
jgi:hypothetical protein